MKVLKFSALSALLLAAACNVYPDYDLGTNFFKTAPPGTVHASSSGTAVHSTSGRCVTGGENEDNADCDIVDAAKGDESGDEATAQPAVHPIIAPAVKVHQDQVIYFDFNKASLTPEMIARLDSLADKLKGKPTLKHVHVVGYADKLGSPAHNMALSQQRADNVLQYLVAKGVAKIDKSKVRWTGATEAKANCPPNIKRAELIDCLKTDRRVEVEFDEAAPPHATAVHAAVAKPHNHPPHHVKSKGTHK